MTAIINNKYSKALYRKCESFESENANFQSTSALSNSLDLQMSQESVKLARSDEKLVEKYLKRICDGNNWMCLKQKVAGKRGWPDRTVYVSDGKIYHVECKDRGKRPRPDQAAVHAALLKMGHLVLLIDTKEKVKQFEFHALYAIPIPADSNLTYPEQSKRSTGRRRRAIPANGLRQDLGSSDGC